MSDLCFPLLTLELPRRADGSAVSMQGGRRRRAQLCTLWSALGKFESRTGMTMASRALEEEPSASPACWSSAKSSARLLLSPTPFCTDAVGLACLVRDFGSGPCRDGSP
jgi:hypothetical protein